MEGKKIDREKEEKRVKREKISTPRQQQKNNRKVDVDLFSSMQVSLVAQETQRTCGRKTERKRKEGMGKEGRAVVSTGAEGSKTRLWRVSSFSVVRDFLIQNGTIGMRENRSRNKDGYTFAG